VTKQADAAPAASPESQRPVVLVTGAAGGIGAAVVADLARDYDILGLVHRQPLDPAVGGLGQVEELTADLSAPDWEEQTRAALGGRLLYGVVHAAWPGAPSGGLLDAPDEAVTRQ